MRASGRPTENERGRLSPGLFSIHFPVLCKRARARRRAAICAINRTGDDVIGHRSAAAYRRNVAGRRAGRRAHCVHVSGRVNAWSRA